MGGYHQLKTVRCTIGLRIDRATQADSQETGTVGGRGRNTTVLVYHFAGTQEQYARRRRGVADGGETIGGVRAEGYLVTLFCEARRSWPVSAIFAVN